MCSIEKLPIDGLEKRVPSVNFFEEFILVEDETTLDGGGRRGQEDY